MAQEIGLRRSQLIGGLTSEIVNTLAVAGTTTHGSKTRPSGSETAASATNLPTRTGTQLGEPGSETPKISLPAIIARTDLREGLRRNPAQFLPPSMRSAIAETWSDVDCGHGWDGYVCGYAIARPVSEADRQSALAFAEETLAPANEDFILAELARLRVLTISRDVGQDLTLVLSAYADQLKRYPADAVREVLRGWRGRFWPAWSELSDMLDPIMAPRKALRDALKRGYREPEYSPDWTPPPTEEQKRQVDELLAEHGIRVDEHGRVRPLEPDPVKLVELERAERELPQIRAMWIARLMADEPADAAE